MNILKLNIKANNKIVIIKFKEMKKFMFFFLMVFLFLGINQARSEATTVTTDNGKSVTDWVLLSPASAMLDEIDGNPDTTKVLRREVVYKRDTARAPFTPMTTKIFTMSSLTDTLFYPTDLNTFTGIRDVIHNPSTANGQVIQYAIDDTLSQLNLYDYRMFWIFNSDTVKLINNKLTDNFFANPMLSTGNYSYKLQGDVNLVDTLRTLTTTHDISDMTIIDTTFRQDSMLIRIDTLWKTDTILAPVPQIIYNPDTILTLIDTFRVIDSIDTILGPPIVIDTVWKDTFYVAKYYIESELDSIYSPPFLVVDHIDTTYISDTLTFYKRDTTYKVRTVSIVNKTIPYRVVNDAGFTINGTTRYRCSVGVDRIKCSDWMSFNYADIKRYESYKYRGEVFDEVNISSLEQDSLRFIGAGANAVAITFDDTILVGKNPYIVKKYVGSNSQFPYPGTYWGYENIIAAESPELVLNSVSPDKIKADGTIDSILCAGSEFEVNISIDGGLDLDISNINAVLSVYEEGNPTPITTRNLDTGNVNNFALDTLIMHDASTSYIFAVDYFQKNVQASLRNYGCYTTDTFRIRAFSTPRIDFRLADSLYTHGSADTLQVCAGFDVPVTFVGAIDTNFKDSILDVKFIINNSITYTVTKPADTNYVYLFDTIYNIQNDTTIICEIQVNNLCIDIDTVSVSIGLAKMTIDYPDTTHFCATGDTNVLRYGGIRPLVNGMPLSSGASLSWSWEPLAAVSGTINDTIDAVSRLITVDFSDLEITEPAIFKLIIEDPGTLGCYVKDSIYFVGLPQLIMKALTDATHYNPLVCLGGEHDLTFVIENLTEDYAPLYGASNNPFITYMMQDSSLSGADTIITTDITLPNDTSALYNVSNYVDTNGRYDYFVTYSFADGQCAGMSDTITVNVAAPLAVNLPFDTTICIEGTARFDLTEVTLDTFLFGESFVWSWTTTNTPTDTVETDTIDDPQTSDNSIPFTANIDSAFINDYYTVNPDNDAIHFNFEIYSQSGLPGCQLKYDTALTVTIFNTDTFVKDSLVYIDAPYVIQDGEVKFCISDFGVFDHLPFTYYATFNNPVFGDTTLSIDDTIRSADLVLFPDTTELVITYTTPGCSTVLESKVNIIIFNTPQINMDTVVDQCENSYVDFVARLDSTIYTDAYRGTDTFRYIWTIDTFDNANTSWVNIDTHVVITNSFVDTFTYQLPFANGLSDQIAVNVAIQNLTTNCQILPNFDGQEFYIYTAALINGGSDTVCENVESTAIPLEIIVTQDNNVHWRITYDTTEIYTNTYSNATNGDTINDTINVLANYAGTLISNALDTFTNGTYPFIVEVWQSNNYDDDVDCRAKDTIYLVTRAVPVIDPNYTYIRFCQDSNTTINVNATGEALTYYWSMSGVAFDTTNNGTCTTPIIDQPAGTIVEIGVAVVTLEGNCGDTMQIPITVVSNPNDNIKFHTSLESDSTCVGKEVTLDAWPQTVPGDSVTGLEVVTYTWTQLSPTNTPIYTGQGDTSIVLENLTNEALGYSYSVEVATSGYNCPPVADTTDTIVIYPTLQVTITPSNDTVCEGSNVAINTQLIIPDTNQLIHYQ